MKGTVTLSKDNKGRVLCMALFMEECPTHTIAGVQELNQQLLPTRVYYGRKMRSQVTEENSHLWGKSLENIYHILAGCSALLRTKYLQRHNKILKILFFEVLRSLGLVTKDEPKLHLNQCPTISA